MARTSAGYRALPARLTPLQTITQGARAQGPGGGDAEMLKRDRAEIWRAGEQMVRDGTITRDTPSDHAADLLVATLIQSQPETYARNGLDWESILSHIDHCLPQILGPGGPESS